MAKKFRRQDPERKEPIQPIRTGAGTKSAVDDIIGFINRDEQLTEKLSAPQLVYPLGRDYMQMIEEHSAFVTGWESGYPEGHLYCNDTNKHETVPGLATLYFTPVFADKDSDGDSMTHQAYLSKWMSARNLDNMTRNWQPGDMQFVDMALALIRLYISVARRVLLTMRDVAQKSSNSYYNPTALLLAQGFKYTVDEAMAQYPQLFAKFNKLISIIKSNDWLSYSFPGAKRWAAMCRHIYRDSPVDTYHAQYYLFVPKYMAAVTVVYEEGKKAGWQLQWRTDADGNPESWENRYMKYGSSGMDVFLADLTALVHAVFYDDSTKDIIATLAAIMKRGYQSELTTSNEIDEDRIDFYPLSDTDPAAHSLPTRYDSAMLLAISNATICYALRPSSTFINPATGRMTCTLHLDDLDSNAADKLGVHNMNLALFSIPKVLNMPNMFPTQSDLINASQWTISCSNTIWDVASTPTDEVPSWIVGSDFISGCDLWYLNRTGENADAQLWEPRAYDRHKYTQVFPETEGNLTSTWWFDDFGYDPYVNIHLAREAWFASDQFAYSPFAYELRLCHNAEGTDARTNWFWRNYGPVTQSEVYHICDGSILKAYHGQWKANFFGFPIFNFREGSVSLTEAKTSESITNESAIGPSSF